MLTMIVIANIITPKIQWQQFGRIFEIFMSVIFANTKMFPGIKYFYRLKISILILTFSTFYKDCRTKYLE